MDSDSFSQKNSNRQSEKALNLNGLGVAIITPFKSDKSISYDDLSKLINYLIDNEVDYLVVLGTTGETPTLSLSEREEIRNFVRNEVDGRVPLVLGMGGNCTSRLIDEINSTDLTGYSAILSVTPFYNKPTQEGLFVHYSEIAKASPLPVILYNVPGRTGVNLPAETTLRLANTFNNIIAIKEASGKLEQIEDILAGKPAHFQVVSGDDSLTYTMIRMGASGVISVVGNALPTEFGAMVRLCMEGKYADAKIIDTKFSDLYDALFCDGNPAGIKSLLHLMGMIDNELRLPLVSTCKATDKRLKAILKDFERI